MHGTFIYIVQVKEHFLDVYIKKFKNIIMPLRYLQQKIIIVHQQQILIKQVNSWITSKLW